MNGKKARELRKADTRKFIGYKRTNIRNKVYTVPNSHPEQTIPYQTCTWEKEYAK